MIEIHKYPRTPHIEGSGLQPGDEDLDVVSFRELTGRHLVVEEKMDGANAGISFTPEGKLLLQSRGHYLVGGERERHFQLFKTWANIHQGALWEVMGDRYLMYGEWLYAKHTIFYTELPHFFLEFDLYDKVADRFLSTERRAEMLRGLACVRSVKVLHEGALASRKALTEMVGASHFIAGGHRERLRELCRERALDAERVLQETDLSGLMEGLYIKVEEADQVTGRYKYVRAGFLTTVLDSQSHWLDRPILPNGLAPGASLF